MIKHIYHTLLVVISTLRVRSGRDGGTGKEGFEPSKSALEADIFPIKLFPPFRIKERKGGGKEELLHTKHNNI